MDKRVIFAVAGSGKTTTLINKLTANKRSLIVTYTDNNVNNIRTAIIQKFGYFPANIKLYSYFQFLYTFCYKPFFAQRLNSKGIEWNMPPEFTLRLKRSDKRFYINKNHYLYYNRIALICECVDNDIIARIEKYYDCFYIDEVQDLAGHDFNLIKNIIPNNCEVLFVGDFFQHTFDTSNDGVVNKHLYKDYAKYQKQFQNMGLVVDTITLNNSHRCCQAVCDFVCQHLGIQMSSAKSTNSTIEFVEGEVNADKIITDNTIVKLFYSISNKYNCFSMNWGDSKGINGFVDICVVLNKTTLKAYKSNSLPNLPPTTKNKLYVACTRAQRNLYFIPYTLLEKYKLR